jgi:CheY-like chemotaxis protein
VGRLTVEPGLPTGLDFGLESAGIPLRILVLEPMGHNAGLLEDVGALTGMAIELVRDPRTMLSRLENDRYDAVVIELPPPGMASIDLFRAIVGIDIDQACRVVFLVNDLSDAATRKFLTDAGRPFLTMPVDPAELYDLVVRVALEDREE